MVSKELGMEDIEGFIAIEKNGGIEDKRKHDIFSQRACMENLKGVVKDPLKTCSEVLK